MLEARQVAEGPAGRNSGFMIDLPHNLGSKDYAGDESHDRAQTAINREAIGFAGNIAADLEMTEEAFVRSGKINAAAGDIGARRNRNYAMHLTSMGEAHEMLDAQAMRSLCGSSYYQNGLFTPGTAMIQPALYIRNLAEGLNRRDVALYEGSPVVSLQKAGSGWCAATRFGKVNAETVLLATNGHVESFGFFKRRLMHIYLYASMTRALSEEECRSLGGEQRWAFTPADPMGTTVRRVAGIGGARIIVRNRFTWAPKRHVSEERLTSIAKVHDRSFKARFPVLASVPMEYRWGGLLCLSWNTVPAFGELEPGLFSACCQNGLGTAMGTASGKLIAELMVGHRSDNLQWMLSRPAPQRLPPEPFASIGANATMRWGEVKAGREL